MTSPGGRSAPELVVGHVVKPHGLRGEVVVHPVSNRPERFAAGSCLGCARPGPHGTGAGAGATVPAVLEVLESRPHQGRFLIRFAGVASIDAAESLRGAELSAPALEDPDAMFVHELIGCSVVDAGGAERGTVTAVEANPASDLLVLEDGHLVPLRFVTGRSPGRLVVDVPDGLFD